MKANNKSLYLWLFIILASICGGIWLDFNGSTYPLEFSRIEVPSKNSTLEEKMIVSIPAKAQIYKLLANFMYGLAVTFVVTIFVTRKLEDEQKEKNENELGKLRDAININVFDALFKKLIPDEIFQIVKAEIIENKVIRKKAHWTLVFEEISNSEIKMTSSNNYELHNISKEKVSDPVNIEIDPLSSNNFKIHKAKCLSSSDQTLVSYDFNAPDELENIEILDLETGGKRVKYVVEVPANDHITSFFEYSSSYSNFVYDCQHTKYPIIELNIQAIFPIGYEFEIHPTLSNELKLISSGSTHKSYKVDGGVLPRQGIIFTLKKIS